MYRRHIYILLIALAFNACKMNYSFSGINIGKGIETFQVDYIPNNATIVEPGLNEEIRNELIDRITSRTNLDEVKKEGDLIYEAEITEYSVAPTTLSVNQTASQSRLTITLKLNYTNTKKEEDNFNKSFSWHYDFPASKTIDEIKDDAHQQILEKIIDDIFNQTLAKW